MGKFYGKIGFAIQRETSPGVWTESFEERFYTGETLKNYTSRWTSEDDTKSINDDISLNNRISILADPFAYNNFYQMRYVEFLGVKWKVTEIETEYPRLMLTVGGVYNG